MSTATAARPRAKKAAAAPIKLAKGEIYAGLTLHEGKPAHLVLLPGFRDDLKWDEAKAWAKDQGGELPSRIDALVLDDANVKGAFKKAWYWTSAPYAHDASSAFLQSFYNGNQSWTWQDDECHARAVRRVPL